MPQRLSSIWFVALRAAVLLVPSPKLVARHDVWIDLQNVPARFRWIVKSPAGPFNVPISATGEVCVVDDRTWVLTPDRTVVICDWKQPH